VRDYLQFKPLYQERVWGGRSLETALGRSIPSGGPIGESWEVVDRPEAQSVVIGGPYDGMTLRVLLESESGAIMGPHWPASHPFPILVKWLDCRERLSLQVHPPAEVAESLHGEPKTENWYIAHATEGARLIVGLKRGVTRDQFEQAIAQGTVESCVHPFAVAVGDSILVHSGEVHAIDAGNLILEIQQNSDTTYRVYDWGRLGLDGKPRKLHIAESLESILWDRVEPSPVRAAPTSGVIADCREFRIRRRVLEPGEPMKVAAGEQPRILSVVSGSIRESSKGAGSSQADVERRTLASGANVLLPYSGDFTFLSEGPAILLITEEFAGSGAARA
jgi:mannose-6-phosphate isomerase